MALFGMLSTTDPLRRTNVIYTQPATSPTSGTSTPISRSPATRPTFGGTVPVAPPRMPTTTTTIAPPLKAPGGSIIVESTGLTSQLPATGGTGSATGSTTGTQTGSTGTSDTSRLLDLISGAFQPQDISQPYGPQSVSDTGPAVASSGTNPMAILVLAIMAIIGVVWWTHRKKKAA